MFVHYVVVYPVVCYTFADVAAHSTLVGDVPATRSGDYLPLRCCPFLTPPVDFHPALPIPRSLFFPTPLTLPIWPGTFSTTFSLRSRSDGVYGDLPFVDEFYHRLIPCLHCSTRLVHCWGPISLLILLQMTFHVWTCVPVPHVTYCCYRCCYVVRTAFPGTCLRTHTPIVEYLPTYHVVVDRCVRLVRYSFVLTGDHCYLR